MQQPPIAPRRICSKHPSARHQLTRAIRSTLNNAHIATSDEITIVCIGSDRSTGDALGPLVGSRLERTPTLGAHVRGTLDQPIHAANLAQHVVKLRNEATDHLVIAVDACLGKAENVGTVCLKPGPLHPGIGVNKKLPQVGHMHVVGVVNIGGFMEYFVLQNTRLSLVVRLANLIADSFIDALSSKRSETEMATADVAATHE